MSSTAMSSFQTPRKAHAALIANLLFATQGFVHLRKTHRQHILCKGCVDVVGIDTGRQPEAALESAIAPLRQEAILLAFFL